MKRISTLFTILVATIVALTSCKDEFPKVPTTEPYLNLTTSATTVAVGGDGTLKVVLDRFVEGSVDATLKSSIPSLVIASPSLSIDPSSEKKEFTTTFTTSAVGEAVIELESDYMGVRYIAKSVKINIVKPKLSLDGSKSCFVGSEVDFTISSNMEVIEDVVITLTSSDPAKLTAPASVTLTKGSKKITGKMTGVAKGDASITFTIASDKVEIGKNEESVELNKINVVVEDAIPDPIKAIISIDGSDIASVNQSFPVVLKSDINVTEDVIFTLTSSDVTVATVPATITMAKGTNLATGVYSALKLGKTIISVKSDNKNVTIAEDKKEMEVTVK